MAVPAPSVGEVDNDGWVTLQVQFEDEEQARFVALGFGPRAEVIAPASLRLLVMADIESLARKFQGSNVPEFQGSNSSRVPEFPRTMNMSIMRRRTLEPRNLGTLEP